MSHIEKNNQEPENGAVNRGISNLPVVKYTKDHAGRIIAAVIALAAMLYIIISNLKA